MIWCPVVQVEEEEEEEAQAADATKATEGANKGAALVAAAPAPKPEGAQQDQSANKVCGAVLCHAMLSCLCAGRQNAREGKGAVARTGRLSGVVATCADYIKSTATLPACLCAGRQAD